MTKKCHECGRRTLERIEDGALTQDDRFVGPVTLTGVTYFRCSACDYTLYTPATMDALLAESRRKLDAWLCDQAVKQFYTSEETATRLGISKQALSKNQRIKRGYIYRIRKGKQLLYLKRSVEQYAQTGDGRFKIDSTTDATVDLMNKWTALKNQCTKSRPRDHATHASAQDADESRKQKLLRAS